MASVSGMFPSKYIKAADLGTKKHKLKISGVVPEKIGEDEKPVLYFQGKEKGLVLNKTNATTIVDLLGTDETNDWEGKDITIYASKTEYQGKRVACVRVFDDGTSNEALPSEDAEIPF